MDAGGAGLHAGGQDVLASPRPECITRQRRPGGGRGAEVAALGGASRASAGATARRSVKAPARLRARAVTARRVGRGAAAGGRRARRRCARGRGASAGSTWASRAAAELPSRTRTSTSGVAAQPTGVVLHARPISMPSDARHGGARQDEQAQLVGTVAVERDPRPRARRGARRPARSCAKTRASHGAGAARAVGRELRRAPGHEAAARGRWRRARRARAPRDRTRRAEEADGGDRRRARRDGRRGRRRSTSAGRGGEGLLGPEREPASRAAHGGLRRRGAERGGQRGERPRSAAPAWPARSASSPTPAASASAREGRAGARRAAAGATRATAPSRRARRGEGARLVADDEGRTAARARRAPRRSRPRARDRAPAGALASAAGRRRGSITRGSARGSTRTRPHRRLAAGDVRAHELEDVATRPRGAAWTRRASSTAPVSATMGRGASGARGEVEQRVRGVEAVGRDRRRPDEAPRRAVAGEGARRDEVDAPAHVEGEVAAHEGARLVDGDAHGALVAADRVRRAASGRPRR